MRNRMMVALRPASTTCVDVPPWARALAAATASVTRRKRHTGGSSTPVGNGCWPGDEPAVVWAEALGSNVVDVDGNRYVDLTSGFGVATLGHRPPESAPVPAELLIRSSCGCVRMESRRGIAAKWDDALRVMGGRIASFLEGAGERALEFAVRCQAAAVGAAVEAFDHREIGFRVPHDRTHGNLGRRRQQAEAAAAAANRLEHALPAEFVHDLREVFGRDVVGLGNLADGDEPVRIGRAIDQHAQRVVGVVGEAHASIIASPPPGGAS